jgi:hypothetical protein
LNGTENTAIDISAAAKFIRYFLKSADILFFSINIRIADILVMRAIKAIPPYIKAKHVGKGSGSATKLDKSEVILDIDELVM